MARYGRDYGRDFEQMGRGRQEGGSRGGWRNQEIGGMRSDGSGSEWRNFPGEEGWYGGPRGYDENFRGGMGGGFGQQGGMRGGRMEGQSSRGGGYGGRDLGYGGGDFGSQGWDSGDQNGQRDSMRAAELMTENPEVVTPDATLVDVARKMRDMDVGLIPVVDSEDNRRLRGVITDRDIAIRAVAEGKDGKAKVSDCMTDQVSSVNKNDAVRQVLSLMEREQIRRVPVTDREGRLVGIIAQADLATEYADTSHRRLHKVQNTIERISEPGASQGGASGRSRSGAGTRMAAGSREREEGGRQG